MTTEEIFSMIDARGIKGMMFHQQMSDYFGFLNLKGYESLHCYRFLEESMELRHIHSYYINHYCKLIGQKEVGDPKAIPESWYRYSKTDVSPSDKYKYILSGFKRWVDWEKETKEKYTEWYKELLDIHEYAAAEIVKNSLADVDEELAKAQSMHIEISDLGGSMDFILSQQNNLCEEYNNKSKTTIGWLW